MLDMGFIPDVRRSPKAFRSGVRLFFSATMPDEIQKLAHEILKQPQHQKVAGQGTPRRWNPQVVYPVDTVRKWICCPSNGVGKDGSGPRFYKDKTQGGSSCGASERKGKRAAALHGNKSQGARNKALEGARNKAIQVLVATNSAARGSM
jgi:ATP-dependent RNA helicase RhlE